MASTAGPSYKGKGKKDLYIHDNRMQDEPKDSPIKEQGTLKVLLYSV